MSVGHVAREIESAGIPTVSICVKAFAERMQMMAVPRLVSTRHPMGRPMGAPDDGERQREVLESALNLLEDAQENGAYVELVQPYRPAPALS